MGWKLSFVWNASTNATEVDVSTPPPPGVPPHVFSLSDAGEPTLAAPRDPDSSRPVVLLLEPDDEDAR